MASVNIRNLTKIFPGAVKAVDDVSVEVEHGRFLTLLGPSGCGKSTILRLIAGLESPSAGEIFIDGRNVGGLHPSQRNIAMVFQSYALYPHMTVFENISVNLKLARIPGEEIVRRVEETASLLGIETLLGRKPSALSGGQRQRVALGRAIVRNPDVFLLDEPLSNLDAILRENMRAELRALFGQLDATVVYVTHDQTEAMTMSDSICVLNEGTIQQIGSPSEIYDSPANLFVANFVGSPRINTVEAEIDGNQLAFPEAVLRIPNPPSGSKDVVVGVRPEDVKVGEGPMRGTVRVVEPLGAFTVLDLEVAGISVKALVDPRDEYGGEVDIDFDRTRLHYFDRGTGKRR
ncbi:MAG: ABC transporter ATP-binding protein [Thermoanaerobaculia bacterium]|nr:ABC transporter ATP-binding protein [Thermoanaerobaculia bacterium]